MGKGDAKALRDAYRAALQDVVTRFDEASLRALRGEIQVVRRWLEARGDDGKARTAREALDALTRLHRFSSEIRGFSASRAYSEKASLFDLGAVGTLAVENVLTADKITPMRLLMSGLSEGLMFLASRQYVAGSGAVLAATYETHAVAVQDALWSLAADFRGAEDLPAIREARAGIDALFAKLDDPALPVAAKVAILYQLDALVALVRCARLLEELGALS